MRNGKREAYFIRDDSERLNTIEDIMGLLELYGLLEPYDFQRFMNDPHIPILLNFNGNGYNGHMTGGTEISGAQFFEIVKVRAPAVLDQVIKERREYIAVTSRVYDHR